MSITSPEKYMDHKNDRYDEAQITKKKLKPKKKLNTERTIKAERISKKPKISKNNDQALKGHPRGAAKSLKTKNKPKYTSEEIKEYQRKKDKQVRQNLKGKTLAKVREKIKIKRNLEKLTKARKDQMASMSYTKSTINIETSHKSARMNGIKDKTKNASMNKNGSKSTRKARKKTAKVKGLKQKPDNILKQHSHETIHSEYEDLENDYLEVYQDHDKSQIENNKNGNMPLKRSKYIGSPPPDYIPIDSEEIKGADESNQGGWLPSQDLVDSNYFNHSEKANEPGLQQPTNIIGMMDTLFNTSRDRYESNDRENPISNDQEEIPRTQLDKTPSEVLDARSPSPKAKV